MTARELRLLEQHFLLSNRLVQFVLRLRSNENSKNRFLILLIITCFFSPMTFNLVYEFLTTSLNLDKTVIELRKLLAGLIMFFTYTSTFFHYVTLKLLLTRMNQDCEQLSDKKEQKIMEKYNKENKFYVYGIVVLLSIYVITITSSCIFKVLLYLFGKLDSNELTLPLAINNNSNAGVLYYCMLIYQTIGFYILLIIGIVCFSTYLVIVQHACCQFSILIWKIQGMFNSDGEYVSRTLESKIKPLDEFNWIADIIVSYRKLTEYVDSINCFSQVTYLIAVFTAMFLIVVDLINLLQLSLIWQNVPKIIEFSVYITGSLFTIYINFYIGQKLLDFSEAVFMELCQIPFYLLSRTTQYILIFLIRRSLKPCMLSIGGLFVSSHETFSGLMQKAFSFAMVYFSVK